MDLDFVELDDWELLHSSDSSPVEETKGFEVINNDSGVFIRRDYFDSRREYLKSTDDELVEKSGVEMGFDGVGKIDDLGVVENEKFEVGLVEKSELDGVGEIDDLGVVENENFDVGLVEKSGIDVGFDGVGEINNLGGVENEKFKVDLTEKSELEVGFDGVGEFAVRDSGVAENENFEVGFAEKSELEGGFDGVRKIVFGNLGSAKNEKIEMGFHGQDERVEEIIARDLGVVQNEESKVGLVGDVDGGEDSRIVLSNSIGVEGNTEMSDGDDLNFQDELVSGGGGQSDEPCDGVDVLTGERESGDGGEKRIMVWWKLPFEFLKYCVLRTSPVWTVGMAAAVMGFVILGCRYYSMKLKSRSVEVKVTMDDKKLSQFKSRVVRLNEAFSVVKHVPIIRHSLPATGVTPWPAITLR